MFGARRFRGLLWVGLLPGVLVLGFLGPSVEGLPVGMGEALGCSGGSNLPAVAWRRLEPAFVRESIGAVPVATDGFFVLVGEANDLSLKEFQEQMGVVVRNEDGSEVPGDVSLLLGADSGAHLFGWAARAPLAVGTRLTATLTTAWPAVGGEYALEVEGEPTSAATPEATFDRWGTIHASDGSGEFVSCRATCSGEQLTIPAHLVEQVSAFADWTAPEIVGGVAWRIRVEAASPAGEVTGERLFFGDIDAAGGVPLFEVGRVDFRDHADAYCVDVVLEDLRTGIEQRSELCSAPGSLETFGAAAELGRCSEPPSAELTPLWCELNSYAPADYPECARNGGGQPAVAAADGPSEERSLSGCALGDKNSGPPAFIALGGLALTALVRRWKRRRPAR